MAAASSNDLKVTELSAQDNMKKVQDSVGKIDDNEDAPPPHFRTKKSAQEHLASLGLQKDLTDLLLLPIREGLQRKNSMP